MANEVALAFSGGVDSTIAAYKLSQAGYHIHAVHFDFWKWVQAGKPQSAGDEIAHRFNELEAIVDITAAEMDARQIMRSVVVEDFQRQLMIGRTPSPCIRCNPLVKFKLLLKYADQHSIRKIATGHYARVRQDSAGKFTLHKAADLSKDQSYMLCYLDQAILSRVIFPLGDTTKTDNRALAEQLGLPVSQQSDSQDLCFLNGASYNDFVRHFTPEILEPGDIVDTQGNLLGRHDGLALYTIGQRKGIRIASTAAYYVVEKDIPHNRLIVGYLEELGKARMQVDNVHWISGIERENLLCDVKIRYRSKLYKARVTKQESEQKYLVEFDQKLRDITPGQYAVFYKGDEVLGGGMIAKAL
jgi:tRNA-specific 2-thiouridylase